MAKIKLTKTAVDAAQPKTCDVELRDTIVPGFLCKVTPAGRKVFMLQYRTNSGVRRKPALGQFGELTVEQARSLAQDWLAEVRRGGDPGHDKAEARKAPTVKELCGRFMEDHSKPHNKPSTQDGYQYQIDSFVIPAFGSKKVHEVTRHDITALMKRMEKSPTQANRVLSLARKMFNLSELWGYRPDGSNPCRHVPKYPEKGSTRLITDEQMVSLFAYLDKAEAEKLEHPIYLLAVRLQFEFAARMSEILLLQWDWLDLPNGRVVWPDSKTGDMSKPLSEEARRLLTNAPRYGKSPYVCPAILDHDKALGPHSYYQAWRRILDRAGVPKVGTHGIRHRSATDIANSGIPVKVGMALTAHKTVAMFMRYVHTEDDPVRKAAELVANRRKSVVSARQEPEQVAA
ncbi:site-specific recombinase XerD [Acidovorax temperans]|uniref:Site-specific recombinase XerD n=1 Tax=Acidovorax temperans TaxID=80878 RepID=A0A543LIW0_9BURK|nr:site-specific integrase [Acidovorax temperans]TQN07266.1 site-specific recombinase XerD [Acidovorax temperans]